MVLTLILAESSIELVPNEIAHHPSVTKSAERKRKESRQVILDQSYHHPAILRLRGRGIGRGRPDITHFSLLTALGSPLNTDRKLRCFVHTIDDHVITVDPKARLPRNTDRFTSLLEQLFEESKVPSSGPPLMSLKQESLTGLVHALSPDVVTALSIQGSPKPMETVVADLAAAKNPVLLVGGFPVGHFSAKTIGLSSSIYRIDHRSLEAWTVVGRAIYDYERALGLRRF